MNELQQQPLGRKQYCNTIITAVQGPGHIPYERLYPHNGRYEWYICTVGTAGVREEMF